MHLCAHQMGLLGALIYESINMQMQQFLFVFSQGAARVYSPAYEI